MNASNKLNDKNKPLVSDGDIPLDPFAVDIFGTGSSASEIILQEEIKFSHPIEKKVKKSDWAKYLPKLTNREAEFSYLLKTIPDGLSNKAIEIIARAIAHYTFRQPENVDLSIISISESNLNETLNKISKSPKIFFTFAAQPDNATAIIAINNDFAAAVIDLILGGKGKELVHARGLSPIEKAILQFLALNILREINSFFGAPLLFLQNISHELKQNFPSGERGAEVVANLDLEEVSGIFSLIAPQRFLQNLEKTENPLLKTKRERKSLSFFEKFVPQLEMSVQIGTTSLDAENLLFLEPNDIILLEKSEIIDNAFKDKMQICIGRGKNFRLNGTFNDEFNFIIEEILSEESRRKFMPAKFKMDEKEKELTETGETNEAFQTDISPSLENLHVSLRVEIAGNKITLRELQNLHNGQVIALGCRPTDPVRLVTDNNDEPVANGELIEIEGQLGVRLTKVFI